MDEEYNNNKKLVEPELTKGSGSKVIEVKEWEGPKNSTNRVSQEWHMITHCTKDPFRKAVLIAELATNENNVSFYNEEDEKKLIEAEKQKKAEA